jgi:DNA-binding NarL/FixJ family response regulator
MPCHPKGGQPWHHKANRSFSHWNLPQMKRQKNANVKKVFLVEDHPVYAEGLVEILKSEPNLTVCGQAASAEEALRDIPRLKPDLALVDITLPGMSGLELINDVLAGRIYVSEDVMVGKSKLSHEGRPQHRSRPIDRLSDLELEILGLLGAGKSNPEIASLLNLGAESLTGQYAKMRKKLRLNNTNALVRFAVCWTGSGEA